MPEVTVRALLDQAKRRLGSGPAEQLDAQLLLAHALGRERAWLFANPEHKPDEGSVEQFRDLLARRARGEPVAYLTGTREFWSLPLVVTPSPAS